MKVPVPSRPVRWALGVALLTPLGLFFAAGFGLPRAAPIPPGPGDRLVLTHDTTVRIHETGPGKPGPTILLLHGFGSSLDEWARVMEALPERHCIAIDLPGFGGSDRSVETFDVDAQSARLIGLMDTLGIEQSVIAGRSMGGSIAAWTAAHHPTRVSAVALLAPSGVSGSMRHTFPLPYLYREGPANRILSAIAGTTLFQAAFPESLARQILGVTASYGEPFESALPRIHQKALLVWSRGDHRTPFEYHAVYLREIPDCRFVEAPIEVGHSLSVRFSTEIAKSLEELIVAAAGPAQDPSPTTTSR